MNSSHGSSPELLQDLEGYTPLRLAVAGGHADVVEALMAFSSYKSCLSTAAELKDSSLAAELLFLALRLDSPGIVALLRPHVSDINRRNVCGETALFFATRLGSSECIKILLQKNGPSQPDPNITVRVRVWTPLTVASVQGYAQIVDLLIQAGADINAKDAFNWRIMEHAGYRGHLQIAEMVLTSNHPEPLKHAGVSVKFSQSSPTTANDLEVYVNLGPLNTRNNKKVVDLSYY